MQGDTLSTPDGASSGFCGRLYVRPELRPRPLPGLPCQLPGLPPGSYVVRLVRWRPGERLTVYGCEVGKAIGAVTVGEA